MGDLLNREHKCPSDWQRKEPVDSGLNTPRSSIVQYFIEDDKDVTSRAQSPGASAPESDRPQSNATGHQPNVYEDRRQQTQQQQQNQLDTRISLPPLRPFLGELAFSPPASPFLGARTDPRIQSINLPPHKALAFYPNNASRLNPPDQWKNADSPPDSPGSMPYSLTSRKTSLNSLAPLEAANQGVLPSPMTASTYGFAPEQSQQQQQQQHHHHHHAPFPAFGGLDRRSSLRERYHDSAMYSPYEQSSMMHEQRPRGQSNPVLTRGTSEFGPDSVAHGHHPNRASVGHGPGYNGVYHTARPSPAGPGPEYFESQAQYPVMSYEYTLARARKRSNLPKHSTEIMKKWFDEHIDSPYPSEDQKRQFAAAANINLTQVSNWFINHRRRCPELKEKRDKNMQLSSVPFGPLT